MPNSPYAKLLVSIDGGAYASGGFNISGSNVIRLKGESTSFWQQAKFEIYAYPVGFACPAGWSNINGVYTYDAAFVPPSFTIDSISNWGKYLFRLTVNGGLYNGVFHGVGDAQPLVDEASGVQVLSSHGFHDIALGENTQFDTLRGYIGELQTTLRAIDAMGAGGGGGVPGGSDNQFQYKNGSLFAGAPNLIWDTTNSRAQAVGSFAVKNSGNAFQAILTSTQSADHSFAIPDTASDTFAMIAATQTLTNKTIVASNNTLTDTGATTGDLLVHDGTRFVRLANPGTNGTFLGVSGGVVGFYAPSATATAGGSDTQVQYNNGGVLAGGANMTYVGGFFRLATALKLMDGSFAASLDTGTLSGDIALTLPSATTILVGRDTTDTLTNKTIDVLDTGNVLTGTGAVAGALLVHNGTRYIPFNMTGATPGQLLAVNTTLDGYTFVNAPTGGGGGGGGALPNFTQVSGTAVGATPVNLTLAAGGEITLQDNTTYSLYVDVVGHRTDVAGNSRRSYQILVHTAGGTLTIDDSAIDVDAPNDLPFDVAFSNPSGLIFRVTLTTGAVAGTPNVHYTAFVTTGGPMVGAGGGTGGSSDGVATTVQTSNGSGAFVGATGFLAGAQYFNLQDRSSAPASPSSGGSFYIDATDHALKIVQANGKKIMLTESFGDASVLSQADWYIDSASGSDTDTGASGHALKTWKELMRRWGKLATLYNGNIKVHITSAGLPSTDPIFIPPGVTLGPETVLWILGTATTVRTGSITALTTLNRGTNTPWDITDSALPGASDWSANVGQRLRDTTASMSIGPSGVVMESCAWVAKDLGSKKARITQFGTSPSDPTNDDTFTQNTPAVGHNYTVETLCDVYIDTVSINASGYGSSLTAFPGIVFKDITARAAASGDFILLNVSANQCLFINCRFRDAVLSSSNEVLYSNCAFDATGLSGGGGFTTNVNGEQSIVDAGLVSALSNGISNCLVANDCLFQGVEVVCEGVNTFLCAIGVFDSPAAGIFIDVGANVVVDGARSGTGGVSALYGSGNTGEAVAIAESSRLSYKTGTTLAITGASDFTIGGASSVYGFNMSTGAYVGATTTTWAHLAAALGAGTGFGGSAHNPDCDSHLVKFA